MGETVNFTLFPETLTKYLDIVDPGVGTIRFYYHIQTHNRSKLLRYQIDRLSGVYDISYDELETKHITLHEYFKNTLTFLKLQTETIMNDDNKGYMEDVSEKDAELINYIYKLIVGQGNNE